MQVSTAPTWLQTPLKSFSAELRNALKQRSLAAIHIQIGSTSPNAIHLRLTTGLYTWLFEEWSQLTAQNQTWIALCTMIQEAFQWHLNAIAPTAGHYSYALAMPHQQNAFGILGEMMAELDDESADTVTTQLAALTYQSQLTASKAANLLEQVEQQFAHVASQQNLMHENMHQIIAQVNALSFNQSNAGQGRLGSFNSSSCGWSHSRHQQGGAQTAVNGGQFGGGFVPAASSYAHGPTAAVAPNQGRGPPFSRRPQETVKEVRCSTIHLREVMVREDTATLLKVVIPPQPCS
jgi:hypothetical protein